MGVFYSAYDIYNLFAVLASAGLPVAVSRMISETLVRGNRDEAERIYNVALRLFAVIGAVVALFMFLFGDWLAGLINNPDAGFSIRVLAVTAFCAFLMSGLRGYFQGHSVMTYTAVSQVIEAVVKLGLGIALALVVVKAGANDSVSSAAAISGVSAGAVLAVFFLLICKKRFSGGTERTGMPVRTDRQIIKELFRIAIPVSLGASVMSVVNVIDDVIIMGLLQDGRRAGPIFLSGLDFGYPAAKALNGVFGNAKKVFNFPSAFIVPFTVSILPVLTAAWTARDNEGVKKNMTNCFKYSLMLALPSGIGMFVLAEPIFKILYPRGDAENGVIMLATFGIAVILYAVVSITGAILQAFGKVNLPLFSLTVGGIIKCILTTVLVSIPALNIKGAPVATCVCYVVMICMNLWFLRSYMKGCAKPILLSTVKTAAAALLMGGAAYLLNLLLGSRIGVRTGGLVSIAAAAAVYAVLIFLFRVVTVSELKNIRKRG
jgi:stage V sporulation protein B